MTKFLIGLVVAYVAIVIGAYLLQDDLLYHPSHQPLPNPATLAPAYQAIPLTTQDGLQLTAWYAPAKAGKPTLFEMHGNAENLHDRLQLAQPYLNAGWGVFLLGYRGFADNPGKITEQGLYLDAAAGWNYLDQHQVSNQCIVLYGKSLGTGVAVQTALTHHAAALVLQSPYTSIPAVAEAHYPFLPIKWLLKSQYNSLAKIKAVHLPLLIVHGDKDHLIPIKFGEILFMAANSPKQFILFPGVGHESWNYQQLGAAVIPWAMQYTEACQPTP
ncbi:MAG: alpha/beta hydrolase [Gammaproteobacteria bacterium]